MGILDSVFKKLRQKVKKCPHCHKWIPLEKFNKHRRDCKRKRKLQDKKAKRERRRRRH